jgi:hypothetical protein
MDDTILVADMPTLYREVLDAVARLERAGERVAAYEIRSRAIATYSSRWDDRGKRALGKLAREASNRLSTATRGTVTAFSGNSEAA